MRPSRVCVAVATVLLVVCHARVARAQAFHEAIRACGRAFQSSSNRWHNLEDCGIRIFAARPLRPAVQSLPPGNGLGFGVHLEKLFNSARGDQHLTFAEGVIAPSGSWRAKGTLQFSFKPDTFSSGPNYVLALTAEAVDAHTIDFYGIGPDAAEANTPFRYRSFSVGANGRIPLGSALTVGGAIDVLAPTAKGAEDAPFIGATRPDPELPGLGTQLTYLRSGLFVAVHDPESQNNPAWRYSARYEWFHTEDPYAFGRFTVDARHDLPIPGAGGYVMLHGRWSASHTGEGSVVPFYLQETLGGTTIRGESSVRGLADYRYRGPDVVLLQAEYRRMLWEPFGISVFYDTGTVATADGSLSGGKFRHSFGVGMTISIPTTVVLRLYIARAADNWHPFVGIMDGF